MTKHWKLNLKIQHHYFLELTAFYTYFPINSKIAEANPDWANEAGENYTTNGPFKMTEW